MSTNPKCGCKVGYGYSDAAESRYEHVDSSNCIAPQLQQRVSSLEQELERKEIEIGARWQENWESRLAKMLRINDAVNKADIAKAEADRDALAEQLKLSEYNADGLREAKRGLFNSFQDMREQLKLAIEAIANAHDKLIDVRRIHNSSEHGSFQGDCTCASMAGLHGAMNVLWDSVRKRDALARLSGGGK